MSAEIPELMEFFQQANFVRAFNKGYVICAQDDAFDHVYMVKSGMVKMYDLDNKGLERTIAIFSTKNVFPLTWLLNVPPKQHQYFYEAYTDTLCYVAPREKLYAYAHENPILLLGALAGLTKSYMNMAARLRNLERSQVKERLEFVLYMLATDLGNFHGDVAEIETSITQEDISKLAGVTRESISLEMNQAQDLIWKNGRHTFINTGKINRSDLPAVLSE